MRNILYACTVNNASQYSLRVRMPCGCPENANPIMPAWTVDVAARNWSSPNIYIRSALGSEYLSRS